ncbi:MAG: UDP-3-O-acyl-N-acetylglucosamine deacetylase [Paludibacteraceae bacterium]|nr:UDP-3-O-acyl-N-acetylglucosamine deacetylase [Paludibacteraceae bacterium]
MEQKTLKKAFCLSGKGLHTGAMVHTTVKPATVHTGIRMTRVDLPGKPSCEALVEWVTKTSRGTVLENGQWKISTIEHLMSALYALGVTNAEVEVDAPEVPILDGSAKPWVEAIEEAGLENQGEPAKEWVVTEPVVLHNAKGSRLKILPSEQYEAEVIVDYGSPILGQQVATLKDLKTYPSEIASARTFCFLREIKHLLHVGLIKGGDLQNALVIYDKKIWQWSMNRLAKKMGQDPVDASKLGYMSPLKYDNEPARHKLLDLIGDMALLGVRIRGKVVAEKPGHGFNTWCCKEIRKNILK